MERREGAISGLGPIRGVLRGGTAAGRATLAAVILLAVVLPAAGGKKKKDSIPYTIVPFLGTKRNPIEAPPTVRLAQEGLTAEITYVTGIARRRMMEATLGLDFDPFASPPGQPPRFHTFLLSLENGSSRDIIFNPSTAWIITDHDERTYGDDYTYLYQTVGRSTGLDMDQVRRVAYDRALTLGPGGRAKKLLVFNEIPGKWKIFSLGMTLESDGSAPQELTVKFRRKFLEVEP